jgi:hypothetical protein
VFDRVGHRGAFGRAAWLVLAVVLATVIAVGLAILFGGGNGAGGGGIGY